jgi:hypothetical protein
VVRQPAAEVVVNSMKPLPGMEAMMTAPQGR